MPSTIPIFLSLPLLSLVLMGSPHYKTRMAATECFSYCYDLGIVDWQTLLVGLDNKDAEVRRRVEAIVAKRHHEALIIEVYVDFDVDKQAGRTVREMKSHGFNVGSAYLCFLSGVHVVRFYRPIDQQETKK